MSSGNGTTILNGNLKKTLTFGIGGGTGIVSILYFSFHMFTAQVDGAFHDIETRLTIMEERLINIESDLKRSMDMMQNIDEHVKEVDEHILDRGR